MTRASSKRLGRMLVRAGVITDEQLAEAVASADGRSLPHVLAELGFASDTASRRRSPSRWASPSSTSLPTRSTATRRILLVPISCARYVVLPIELQDDELVVAMADPANIFAIDDLRIVTGNEIRPVVAAESDLVPAIESSRRADRTSRTWSATSPAVADRRGRREERATARSRRSPAHEPDHHRGDPAGRRRHLHRAAGARAAGPVPHRRRVPGGHRACPQEAAPAADQPPQDHVRHGHRREARPAGRPLRRRARRQGGRLPRRRAAAWSTARWRSCACCAATRS